MLSGILKDSHNAGRNFAVSPVERMNKKNREGFISIDDKSIKRIITVRMPEGFSP